MSSYMLDTTLEVTKRSAIQSRSPRFRRLKSSWPAAIRRAARTTLELALRKPRRTQRSRPSNLISSPKFQPLRKRHEPQKDRRFRIPSALTTRHCQPPAVAPHTTMFAVATNLVPMRRETRLLVGWDRQFESPPLHQRVTANRQRSHLTRQCSRLQQICSNATRN